ncbi:glycosyltransferase [Arthrobacter sp. AOP36-A1-22]|uniref:glycosyltransferase n=1 Tax=Arthrobacter sp. AOP36-A1-22 TaxID=3457684 RepID=UPI004034BF4A
MTFDTEQSRSLLAGKRVLWVPYIAPRDLKSTVVAARRLRAKIRDESFDAVYSTGAALALAAFCQPSLRGTPKTFIESVSRTKGPSLTGTIVEALRLAELRTQHDSWSNERWKKIPGVLSDFRTQTNLDSGTVQKVLVTLGTIRPYRFDALVDAVMATGLVGEGTIWQVGVTTRTDLPGRVVSEMTASEFTSCATEADIIVTHSGVGTILQLLEMGKSPVVVPRRKSRGEHVDDHQLQIAGLLSEKNLGVVTEVENLTMDHLLLSARQETLPRGVHV